MSDRAVIAILIFLLIVVVIIVLRYDKEVRALFGRLEKLRADRQGFESTFSPPSVMADDATGPGAAPAAEEDKDSDLEEGETGSEVIDIQAEADTEVLSTEMIRAIFAQKIERAKEARERIREVASDPADSARADAAYDAATFDKTGDPEAFKRLRDRAKDSRITPQDESLTGMVLENVKRPAEAAEAFKRASEAATNPDFRARMLARRVDALVDIRQADAAEREVKAALREEPDDGARARLWRALAKTFEARELYLDQAASLQEAREHEPNDADLCFRIAWALSQDGREELRAAAIHFYQLSIYLDATETYALNNLGWEYSKAELPIHATTYYNRAAEAGNTLAMANLAGIKLRAGLADDADELLKKAREKDDAHENVAGVQADVTKARSKQTAKAHDLEEIGAQLAEFLSQKAQAQLSSSPIELSKEWRWENGESITLSLSHAQLIGEWEEGKAKYRLEAKVHGRAGEGSLSLMGTRFSYVEETHIETGWEKKKVVLLVLDEGDQSIQIALLNGDSAEFQRLEVVG